MDNDSNAIVSRRITQTLELAIQVMLSWNVLPTSEWEIPMKKGG